MGTIIFKKLARHYKRLDHLSPAQKARYITQTVFGEIFRTRRLDFFGPRLVEITLTDRCQCRCVHCYNENAVPLSPQNELSTAEVYSVLEQAAAIRCNEVCFTGGEPLLREDLLELIRHARSVNLVPKVNTNGILLSSEMVSNLKKAGLAWCSVSVDSPVPERHDELRRYTGCYEKVVTGLKELVTQGVPASITTYVRRAALYNGDLQKIIDLGHELNVETVRMLFPVPMGGFKNAQDEVLTFEEREFARRFLTDPLVTMESAYEKSRCTAAVTKLNILPDGAVTPCVFVPYSYGNIRKESLKAIWKRMVEFDRLCKPNGKCPMCDKEFREKLLSKSEAMSNCDTMNASFISEVLESKQN